jgi:hypothetical protein
MANYSIKQRRIAFFFSIVCAVCCIGQLTHLGLVENREKQVFSEVTACEGKCDATFTEIVLHVVWMVCACLITSIRLLSISMDEKDPETAPFYFSALLYVPVLAIPLFIETILWKESGGYVWIYVSLQVYSFVIALILLAFVGGFILLCFFFILYSSMRLAAAQLFDCSSCRKLQELFNSNYIEETAIDIIQQQQLAEGTQDCSICLQSLRGKEGDDASAVAIPTVSQMKQCKHVYHTQCIATWLNNHTTCPLCRMVIP